MESSDPIGNHLTAEELSTMAEGKFRRFNDEVHVRDCSECQAKLDTLRQS